MGVSWVVHTQAALISSLCSALWFPVTPRRFWHESGTGPNLVLRLAGQTLSYESTTLHNPGQCWYN
jgi:hypothetical protein